MTEEPKDLGWVDGLVQLSFLVQSVLVAAAAQHDLTVQQLRLFGVLRDREPGMMQLARHLGLDKSSVTGLVSRAERRGLVARTASPADGRAVTVAVTSLGRALTERVSADVTAELDRLGPTLTSSDRVIFSRLASRIVGGPDS